MCIKEYELDHAHFLSLPGLAWQACLKKTDIELELLTDYDMLLMVEEGIRGGICHSIHRYAKANNMNTELRKLASNDFEKDLFKSINNSVFGETMENIRKHRDIKLVTTDKNRSKLVSEQNYHTINLISEDLSIIDMKKSKVKMNKSIYLGLSILEISKILMYEFWYDYMKPKYNDTVRLCYTDTDSFIMNIKTNDFYKDISDDVDNTCDTSNYEVKGP